MAGVVVVTGCTTGLGYEAAKALAGAGHTVVLANRNVAASHAAAAAIAAATGAPRDALLVLPLPLDLCDLGSVRAFAAALRAALGARGVAALVNNAGLGTQRILKPTAAGYDPIFCTNHLGHMLLSLLLLPALSRGAVVLNVSSEVHDPAQDTGALDPQQAWPDSDEAYGRVLARGAPVLGESALVSGFRRYSRSKLCNVLFTQDLARRLAGAPPPGADAEARAAAKALPGGAACALPNATSLRVLAMNPGLMLDTSFNSNSFGRVMGALLRLLAPLLRLTPLRRIMRTAAASGALLAQVATGRRHGDAPSGTYFSSDGEPQAASAFARSARGVAVAAPDLWRHSLAWAAVTPAELRDADCF